MMPPWGHQRALQHQQRCASVQVLAVSSFHIWEFLALQLPQSKEADCGAPRLRRDYRVRDR